MSNAVPEFIEILCQPDLVPCQCGSCGQFVALKQMPGGNQLVRCLNRQCVIYDKCAELPPMKRVRLEVVSE